MTDLLTELLTESRARGFLGPGDVQPHLVRAAAFATVLDRPPARALDLGAGGGLPGLVLAATVWPETRWTFLDAQRKRTTFLVEAIERLHLDDRVDVVTGRAEEIARDPAHRETYDVVMARSFGAPAVTAECATGFLRADGCLVVSEPPDADPTVRWPSAALAEIGFGPARPTVVDGEVETHLVRLDRTGPLSDRYPRRTGTPGKRPLFP